MTFATFHPQLFEAVGIIGFALYVINYGMLSFQVMSGNSIAYFTINLVASSCVLVSLASSFNLASALIQGFWVTMSLIAIGLRLMQSTRRAKATLQVAG